MASWELFKLSAKRAARAAIKETGEAADIAGLHIKLKSLEAKRNSEYEILGKLTYRQLKTGISQADRIAPVIENLDNIRAKIKAINAEIEATKASRQERRLRDKALMRELEDDSLEEIVEEVIADARAEDEDDDDEE